MEPVSAIAERLARLEQELAQVRARLARLERREDAPERSTAPAAPPEPLVGDRWRGVPALAGRSCLAMGGAFVFRSLTESGAFSPALGVALGSAYALAWLILADRAAARGLQLSGAFHALVSALIVFPLLFEATTRFALLPPVVAAMALGAVTAAGLAVAWRRSFHTVAWITESAALAVAVLLLFRSHAVLPSPAICWRSPSLPSCWPTGAVGGDSAGSWPSRSTPSCSSSARFVWSGRHRRIGSRPVPF